jgi:hypothetical protein
MNNNNNKVNNMVKDGHHLNSKYWQDYKNSLGPLPPRLSNILVGMILGDAHLAHKDKFPFVKFEQGYLQKDFLFHLYGEFKDYVLLNLILVWNSMVYVKVYLKVMILKLSVTLLSNL